MSLYEFSDLHIDDFNKDAARVLVFLYNYFPRKMEVYIEDVSGLDDVDDYGLHTERHLACMSTIIWLAEEGLIRYESLFKQETFNQSVLTKRSYTLLSNIIQNKLEEDLKSQGTENILPLSITRNRNTRIATMKQALKDKSSEQLKNVITDFISASERG